MMRGFLIHDASGNILRSATRPGQVLPLVGDGDSLLETTPNAWDVSITATHYIAEGVLAERPATGLPASHTIATGVEWPVADVPEGTAVAIDGGEAGTVDATGLILEFPLAAEYRVDLAPPFPWRPASCTVTVT